MKLNKYGKYGINVDMKLNKFKDCSRVKIVANM